MSTAAPINVPIPDINQLTQNAARLLQQSLAQASQTANPASLSASDLQLARSNIAALSFVQGVGVHGAYRYMRDFIARQAIPINAVGTFLDGWLVTYGMTRKEAASAAGSASGTGVNGTVLPLGTVVQTTDGTQYQVSADAVVSGGGFTVALIALIAGAAGNLATSTALTLVSPVVGIDSGLLAGDITGGADQETDSQAVFRLQQRLSSEPMGGSPADYARWALQVPSITRAWGVRNPNGPTTAGVIIMADGNAPPGLPTSGQQSQVLDYIRDPQRGPPDELYVIIPTPVVINVTLNLSPDTECDPRRRDGRAAGPLLPRGGARRLDSAEPHDRGDQLGGRRVQPHDQRAGDHEWRILHRRLLRPAADPWHRDVRLTPCWPASSSR